MIAHEMTFSEDFSNVFSCVWLRLVGTNPGTTIEERDIKSPEDIQ